MSVGPSAAQANAFLDALDLSWVKLHIGDPGGAGAGNPAAETTRKQLSLGDASGGVAVSDAALTWPSITGSEDPTHFSLWDASTAGTFLFSGEITSAAYTAGNTFEIAATDLTLTFPIAAT